MARTEVVIQPSPRGAARTLDMSFPANINYTVGTTNIGNAWLNRQATIVWTFGAAVGRGIPPAGTGWTTYRGRIAHRQTGNGGVAGAFITTDSPFAVDFPQTKDAFNADFQDDTRCWRIVLIAAYDNTFADFDGGLEVGPNMQNLFTISAGSTGILLRPTAQNKVGIVINGGGAVKQDIATVNDTTNYNAYEMRFIGATKTTDAVFKAYVNNVLSFQAAWGAGTVLPPFFVGVITGWAVGTGNLGVSSSQYTPINGLRISAAATEAGLL